MQARFGARIPLKTIDSEPGVYQLANSQNIELLRNENPPLDMDGCGLFFPGLLDGISGDELLISVQNNGSGSQPQTGKAILQTRDGRQQLGVDARVYLHQDRQPYLYSGWDLQMKQFKTAISEPLKRLFSRKDA